MRCGNWIFCMEAGIAGIKETEGDKKKKKKAVVIIRS